METPSTPSSPAHTPNQSVVPSPAASAAQLSNSLAPSTVPPLRLESAPEPPQAARSTRHEASSARPPSQPRAGRRTAYSDEQDIAIVREVAAAEAHIAGFGETRKRFEKAAGLLGENPLFTTKISWKQVQDRYRRLQEQYNSHDNENQRLSGVGGGEMGELADLLMMMREARDDMDAKKTVDKETRKKDDEEKEEAGRRLVAASTSRRRSATESETINLEDDEDDLSSQSARKKRRTSTPAPPGSEMEAFGAQMKEAEIARVELEKERLAFDRTRFAKQSEEREKDRQERREERANDREEREREREAERRERREEREASSKLDLDKFKLMMETFAYKFMK